MTGSRVIAMIVWAAAAGTAVFWGYRLFVKAPPVPPQASVAIAGAPGVGGDLTRLFGAPAPVAPPPSEAAVPADARFKLLGVVAPVAGQRTGLALISIDGKAPRAVGIGGTVDGDLAVVSVSHRRVELGPRGGSGTMALELPALPEAARGTLDATGNAGAPPMGVPPMPAPPMPAPQMQPPAAATPPSFPPRPGMRQGVPGAVSPGAPAAQQQPGVPPAPFGVTPQPGMPGNPAAGGPTTS